MHLIGIFIFPKRVFAQTPVVSNTRKYPANINLILIKVNYYLPLSEYKQRFN